MDDRGISPIDPHRWHHRPAHLFLPDTMYIVTASTLHKRHFFRPARRIARLQQCLFEAGEAYGWRLEAWAFFSNHYHLIAQTPKDGSTLREMVRRVYSQTAREINAEDNRPGRQVWFEFWDTCLTFERSYYARLNYVHDNPKKHGLVSDPEDYTFCSARRFRENAEDAFRRKVEFFRYDRIKIEDDFDVGDRGMMKKAIYTSDNSQKYICREIWLRQPCCRLLTKDLPYYKNQALLKAGLSLALKAGAWLQQSI